MNAASARSRSLRLPGSHDALVYGWVPALAWHNGSYKRSPPAFVICLLKNVSEKCSAAQAVFIYFFLSGFDRVGIDGGVYRVRVYLARVYDNAKLLRFF